MDLKSTFVAYLAQTYSELDKTQMTHLISENLLSPFKIQIKASVLQTIRDDIKKYWALRSWGVDRYDQQYNSKKLRRPNNYSVCMSYDFHISAADQPELIEINTNAAFLAMGSELYRFLNGPEPVSQFTSDKVVQMFKDDYKLAQNKDLKKIFILDENPAEQRLYIEFLVFQKLFNKHNIECEILDLDHLSQDKLNQLTQGENIFIYNRYTDFFLENKKSDLLKTFFNQGKIDLSPNPYEYLLLADKQRLIDWYEQSDLEKPISLLPTYDMAKADKEKIWAERKNLFFKPKNSFGSKQAYKGASVSRKMFDEVTGDQFIAQQFSQPAEIEVEHLGQKIKYKYDLRCYAYQDKLQMIIARLYQGQTTNLRTAGGGFAAVEIIS